MFSNRFFDFLKHPCADGIHRSTKGIYRLSGVKIKHLLEILMLEVVVGTFHEPAIHRIGYAVCHRIFESYFDVEFIILLKEAVGNDVEELLFVIVPILSRQCGCNIFKLCFQYPVSGNTEGNLLIPSASGQAATSLPILLPMGDMADITRQTTCIIFQIGNGLSNILVPTSGTFMVALTMAKVPYGKWAKWFIPLLGLQFAAGAVLVLIANAIRLGPM